jgi:hypothetical protein
VRVERECRVVLDIPALLLRGRRTTAIFQVRRRPQHQETVCACTPRAALRCSERSG